jgi:perosamine synthetase
MIPLIKPFLPPREALLPRLETILYSGYIAEGESVVEFERRLSELLGVSYCLTLNSGTAALHIALRLADVKTGDEVISTALTAEPTNTTIALTGAKVVFADVDPKTGLISPESIESSMSEKTKAIMVVHYAGMVCDMDNINSISLRYGIPVIEDAAHAFMSKYKNRYLGSNSLYTCFSFQAIKHLTTVDGGLLCLKSEEDYNRAKKMRWFGLDKSISRLENDITEAGFKYHMNNINATIGLTQLDFLQENVSKYVENGKYYDSNIDESEDLTRTPYYAHTEPSYWLYTLRVKRREVFIKTCANNGIMASPLHLRNDRHSVFSSKVDLPNLDQFYDEFVHIPCGWWVNEDDRKKIANVINEGW